MLNLFTSSLFTLILYSIFGCLISQNLKSNLISYSKVVINGAILVSFISLFFNFFTPLTKEINSLLYIIIIFFFFKFDLLKSKKYLIFLILISVFTYVLVFSSHTYRPDAGLYHLPYINILNEEKIIFGLANLHFRFGHISIMQYLSAINYNLFTGINGIILPSAIIASTVIINFLSKLKDHILSKNYNFHFYYLLGILIYICFKMNRYAEYGNDAPAHFLTFYFFSECLKFKKKESNLNEILNITLIGVFVILNKITLILILIIPLVYIIKKKFIHVFKKLNFYLIITFVIIWIAKNIIISGCLIYPIKFTCINSLAWTDIKTVEKISLENEAFTKNWPNYEKRNEFTQKEYIKKFNWFKTWSKKLLDEQKEKSFAYALILILIFIYLYNKSNNGSAKSKKNWIFLFTLCIATVFWLIKIPEYRYAYSIIISLITFPFATLLSNRSFDKDQNIFFTSIIIVFISIFFIKNFVRIYNTEIYNNYPYPRIYSHNNDNQKLKYKLKNIDNKIFHTQNDGYCMYGRNLCSPYEIDIKIENKNSYLFFFKKT